MRHRFLIALLAFGTVAGFGSGFCAVRARIHERHDAFERHVADVCTESALRLRDRTP